MSQLNTTGLGAASITTLTEFPVRKTKTQKEAFRRQLTQWLQAENWPVEVEASGRLLPNHNVVAGDLTAAKLVFTAHYDTPARLPFPNFIAPLNLPITLVYQMVLAVVFVVLGLVPAFYALFVTHSILLYMLTLFLCTGLLLWLVMAGPANPANVNDNTSGVLTLLEIAAALPQEMRAHTALVFFDNEEKGLIGSSLFRQKHGSLKETLVVNFDCVSDGDHVMFFPVSALRKKTDLLAFLEQSYLPSPEKTVKVNRNPLAFFPSDQMLFQYGVGVCVLNRAPVIGHYLDKIHTRKDTVLKPENILLLRDGSLQLAQKMMT